MSESDVFRLHVTALDLKFTLLVPGHRKISDVKTQVTAAWGKYKATGLSIAHICNGEGFIQDPAYTVHSVFTQNDKVVVDGGEIKDGSAASGTATQPLLASSAPAAASAGGALKRKLDGQLKRPKRPPTAYKMWAKSEGPQLQANDSDVKLKDVWGDLDDSGKEPFNTKHQEATEAFNQKMELFKAQNVDENGKRLKRQKKERDPNKPPPSAYNLYVQSESKRLEQENKIPKKERFKAIASAWTGMDETKKAVWHQKLAAAKTKYDQAQGKASPPAEEEDNDNDDNDDEDDDDNDDNDDNDNDDDGEDEGGDDDNDDESDDDSDDDDDDSEEETKAPPAPKSPPPKATPKKADVKSEKKKNKKAKEPKVKEEDKAKKKTKKSGKSKKKEQSA